MDFKKIATGTIYHVNNEALIPLYEADKRFVKHEEKPAQEKKTTSKK